MPFDLVIDEETADGREARVSRTSVSGSWGAVAGTLRYFADRFGVPRAGIEGTQIPERAIRRYARRGPPEVVFERQRRREGLMAVRTLTYAGFTLEREVGRLGDPFPSELEEAARQALVRALIAGETPHPDQGKLRRALERFGHYWRRSGGRLAQAQGDRLAQQVAAQLGRVRQSYPCPSGLKEAAHQALVRPLIAGETPHPDQGKLRRALERFGHYWRRSGGRLAQAQGDRLAQQVAAQLARVRSWDDFINAR